MKIAVLGGDGFCGWPCALNLSAGGHDVAIVDNLSRRAIDAELGAGSLTPIATLDERLEAWREVSGRTIACEQFDIAGDYGRLLGFLRAYKPAAVVHYAEQRAAPYSMKSASHKRYTVNNNVNATHNVLAALVEAGVDAHLVHLGTMGVYGYGAQHGATVPEGYLTVEVPLSDGTRFPAQILHPSDPGSIYHMTKVLDQHLFYFYNKNDGVRVTDLHQGVVWGTNTEQTNREARLINRFDYDGEYGTVLNRFLVQAAVGHPLTVYGSGGQSRAFIHIRDSVRCVQLALESPPAAGSKVRIFNQMTEVHRVRELAEKVSALTGAPIRNVVNPRKEALENELRAEHRFLADLGLQPTTLGAGLMEEIVAVARKYADRCDQSKIPSASTWNIERARALDARSP
ncbi:MAG TPA: NAD-dependent epimerase/dehydratase family protein [Burkholderiales bacterium]|nr:NAD-dependent epimerase/dehydratase family protein [Burkholderiales bacterium]